MFSLVLLVVRKVVVFFISPTRAGKVGWVFQNDMSDGADVNEYSLIPHIAPQSFECFIFYNYIEENKDHISDLYCLFLV